MGSPATKKKPSDEAEKLDVPVVDLDRIRETYGELKKMEVKLDPNPIEYGPKRFNNRIARVRAMLNRVDQIFLQVSEDLHLFKRIINAKRTLYEFEKRELMVNDTKVRVGRSQGEREALADVQLRPTLEDLAGLEQAAHDLETLMISIKSKRTDLKDAQGRMRDQMKMIEHDISMGARWGNNAAPSAASANVSDIDSMLATVDSGFGLADDDEDEEELEEEDETDEDETDEEEEAEDEDEVVADDAGHDPSPHAEAPVLVFGEGEDADEEMEAKEDESDDIEKLLPDDDSVSEVPGDDNTSDDVESFLDSIGGDDENDEEEASGDEEDDGEDDVSGIDDLIASLADD